MKKAPDKYETMRSRLTLSITQINKRIPKKSKLKALHIVDPVYSPCGKMHRRALFECTCGTLKEINISTVCQGKTISCGCAILTPTIKLRFGPLEKKFQRLHRGMMQRCYNTNDQHYKYYGAKGVRVCKEWRKGYRPFMEWALNNGWKQGLHIDKDIKSPTKPGKLYSPETCSIVTKFDNNTHRSESSWITVILDGEKINLKQACEKMGLNYETTRGKMKRKGITFEEAIKIK